MATKNEASAGEQPPLARPRKEWHEEMGDVLWWRLPIMEPPHCGTPTDSAWPEEDNQFEAGHLPVGYYTHFTPIQVPTGATDGAAIA